VGEGARVATPVAVPALASKFQGCLAGLAVGDAFGAPYEGGVVERAVWWAIGRTKEGHRRWTDDTQMSLDLARSLLAHGQLKPEHLAASFAASYRWSRGYGAGTSRILKDIRAGTGWEKASTSAFSGGSFGNGGAMRAPVVALFCYLRDEGDGTILERTTRAATAVTHAHPLAIDGALLIAHATHKALLHKSLASVMPEMRDLCREPKMTERVNVMIDLLESDFSPRMVRKILGNGVAAVDSCPTALFAAARFQASPFEELLAFCKACGGDVDTITAMAAAIWGAFNGVECIPAEMLMAVEAIEEIQALAEALLSGPPT
jgi:poly(ADP-ribose) glycohydrolase ARH3